MREGVLLAPLELEAPALEAWDCRGAEFEHVGGGCGGRSGGDSGRRES